MNLTQQEYVAARNRSSDCHHAAAKMEIYEEEAYPSKVDPKRTKLKLWCAQCRAVKLYYKHASGLKQTDRY